MVRHNKKFMIIYPESTLKTKWDIFIAVVLITSCMLTPIELAFFMNKTDSWNITNIIIDIMFLLDILIIFNTAYYDDDFKLIEDRVLIAKDYVTGWFTVDVIAIVPFDLFFMNGYN